MEVQLTAREMFEKLGYEQSRIINDFYKLKINYLEYKKQDIYIVFSDYSEPRAICKFKNKLFKVKVEDITIAELQAINKQVEELQWNK